MNSILKLTSAILFIGIIGCSSFRKNYVETYGMTGKTKINLHKRNDDKRLEVINECSEKWLFLSLKTEIQLKVLQYRKSYRFDLFSIPALLIGVSKNNDTLRILNIDYKEDINKNQLVTILSDTLVDKKSQVELALMRRDIPVFLSKVKDEDSFFCDVKNTYFGKIVK